MTDNEIIKAFEYCTNSLDCPANCPLYEYAGDCFLALHKPTLDLINRQKAEIERLKKAIEQCEDSGEYWESKYKTAKAEAIKEFAERLKNKFEISSAYSFGYIACQLDNLVKELVGDTE